jgi:hypothetical protein
MMYHQVPAADRSKMIALVDMCVGECFWRRRFVRNWMDHGIDHAYADWLAGAPKRVPEFLPQIAQLIEEIKRCPFKPFPASPPPPGPQ